MKLLLSSLLFASASMLSAAAPQAATPAAQPAVQPTPPSIERQMLARQYISLTVSPDEFIATMRTAAAAMIEAKSKKKVMETSR